MGAKHAVAVSSGGAALHVALLAADVRPGDRVIVPPLTFAATAHAALLCGAQVIFGDIDAHSLTLAAKTLPGPARAIVPVSFAGHACDLAGLRAAAPDALIVEDACHRALPRDPHAAASCYSLHPAKAVAAGEGGMIATDLERLDARARVIRVYGRQDEEIVALGPNYRLDEISATLAASQLTRLERNQARRATHAQWYRAALGARGRADLALPPDIDTHAWHLFVVLLDLDRLRVDRDAVVRALKAEGIGATVHYRLVYRHPYYRDLGYAQSGLCPTAEWVADRIMTLPLFPSMTERDRQDVVDALDKVLGAYRR
jgi:dTDP-4-amino-4,6-dideoxygalactose transaminase